jgi:hypothetical protein
MTLYEVKVSKCPLSLNFEYVGKCAGFKALFVTRMGRKFCFVSNTESKPAHDIQRLVPYSTEKELGDLSSRFAILTVKYRHERKWFTLLLHFGVAIHNLIANYFSCLCNFNEKWNGQIFQESESEIENEVDPFEINEHFHYFHSQLKSVSKFI